MEHCKMSDQKRDIGFIKFPLGVHSQTLCKGGLMQKIFITKNFQPPPFRPQTISGPTFFAMKITGQPHRKAGKLNFYKKIWGNFFSRPPLQWSKICKAPLFAPAPTPTHSQVFMNAPLEIEIDTSAFQSTFLACSPSTSFLDVHRTQSLHKPQFLTLIYSTLWILFLWHDEIFTFWQQPHEHNLHIICISVFLFVLK